MKMFSVDRVDIGMGGKYCKMCYRNTYMTGSTAEKKNMQDVALRMCDMQGAHL